MINFPETIKEDLSAIVRVSDDLKMRTYVVGGFPRDIISGKGITDDTDLDVTEKNGNAFDLAFFVAAKFNLPEPEIYESSGTSMLAMPSGRVVEFHNAYHNVSHIIDQLYVLGVEPTSLNKDVYSRDFTINTLLYDPKDDEIIDLTQKGVSDIRDKVLRTPINPMKALRNDPKRVLRGIRFKVEMGLSPTPEYEEAEAHFAPILANFMITKPNSQMLTKTIEKIFSADPQRGYTEFEKLGLLPYLPRVEGMDDIARQRIFGGSGSWYKKSSEKDWRSVVGKPRLATISDLEALAKEYLPGGLASDRPDSDFDPEQLKKGIEVELEHVDHRGIAKEIAKDHLTEDPQYYDHLKEMEDKYKKDNEKKCGNSVISEEIAVGPRVNVSSSGSWYKGAQTDNEEDIKRRLTGLPRSEREEDTSKKMIERILDEREKHRAYMRRKRMEQKRDSIELQELFDAMQSGDKGRLNKHVDEKKVRKQNEKNLMTEKQYA